MELHDLAKELVLNNKIRASCQKFALLPSIIVRMNLEKLLMKSNSFQNHHCDLLSFASLKWEMVRFCFKILLKIIYN